MKFINKKLLFVFLLIGCTFIGYFFWLSLRPVDIIAVHEDGSFSDVLVSHFPLTDQGKIDWWLKNHDLLKQRYGIPKPTSHGNYTVSFWLFGEGYKKEGKFDRLCFNDMKTPINCIEKNRVFWASYSKNRGTIFTVNDGEYRLKEGEVIKLKDE